MESIKTTREIAEEITYSSGDNKITEKLTYIGEGSNCVVYETERRNIIKEFYPTVGNIVRIDIVSDL